MKCFFAGNVIQMLPIPKGIIAAILSDVTEDGKMAVEYHMLSLETGQTQRITKSVYMLAKFGASHKAAEMQVVNHLTCRTCLVNGGEIFTVEEDSNAKLLDYDGFAKWVGVVKYKGEAPADVIFDGKNIWASFTENDSLLRLDIGSMREELRIGGKKEESNFSGPMGMFAEGDTLFVANKNSCRIWKINTRTYHAEEYLAFDEPVYGYAKYLNRELVHLKSGIYEV